MRTRSALLGSLVVFSAVSVAEAQTPEPSTLPPQLLQDALDLQARSNVVQGSGARALGMGGAFLARADDATAASWNPAGLSYLRLPEVSFVYSGGRLNSLETTASTTKDDRRHGSTPEFFAAAYPFEFGGLSGSAQLSFQRLISFGGKRTITESTAADPSADTPAFTRPSAVTSSGGFDVYSFGTGVSVRGHLRVGATVNRWSNGYHQTLDRDTLRGDIAGHTTQDSDYYLAGWNVNLGVMWSPREDFNLGAVYKSAFTGHVNLAKNRVDLTVPSTSNQATSGELGAPVTLDFPAAVGAGVSWRPRSRLTVSADYTRTAWSKGRIHNFFLLPQAVAGAAPIVVPVLPYPTLDPREQQQHDTEQIRGGAEFVFFLGGVKWPVRAGVFRDRQYVQAADGRAPWFTGLTVGSGVVIGPLLLDLAYIHETGDYPTANSDGTKTTVSVRSHRIIGSFIFRPPRL